MPSFKRQTERKVPAQAVIRKIKTLCTFSIFRHITRPWTVMFSNLSFLVFTSSLSNSFSKRLLLCSGVASQFSVFCESRRISRSLCWKALQPVPANFRGSLFAIFLISGSTDVERISYLPLPVAIS
jgi:hypothetical protein